MGIYIKANYTEAQIRAYTAKQMNLYINKVVDIYSQAGRAMVDDARSRTKELGSYDGGSFGNITWNLRSSIGCGIYVDGSSRFKYAPVLNTGSEGSQNALDYLDSLAEGIEGIQLIVVAGEDYARSVENRGYNVITSTALQAETFLQDYIHRAQL